LKYLIIVFFINSILSTNIAYAAQEQCILKMGYKTNAKEPYILKDNSGLYKDLYEAAAKIIGCKLEIVRAPKKRILAKLKQGKIDFYPGFTFSTDRAKYVHYIKNGLPKDFAIISRIETPDLKDINQLKALNLSVLIELGGANVLRNLNLKCVKVHELNLNKAVAMIQKNRADLYIYNKAQIDYYFKKYQPKGLKVQVDVFNKKESLLLGFSKKSKYITEVKNLKYSEKQLLTYLDHPTILEESSVASQFKNALSQLKNNGTTTQLYQKYFY